MTSVVFRTPKLFDGQIYSLVRDLLDVSPDGEAVISYALDESTKLNAETDFSDLTASEDRLVNSMEFRFPGTIRERVLFHRGVVDEDTWRQHPDASGFSRSIPSAHFDELGLLAQPRQSYGSQQPKPDSLDREDVFSITRLLNALAVETTFVGQGDSATNLADIVSGQIADLRKLHLEMTRGLLAAQKEADQQNSSRRTDLERDIDQQRKSLLEKENDLEKRRLELNDREPQHERRRLREHLTDRLQESLSNPKKDSIDREWRSNLFYLAVGFGFISISFVLTLQADLLPSSANQTAFWAASLKSIISGIAGAAFSWAGLSGLKSSAQSAREYDQQIQRYAFDMDRASWIVETILQMNSSETSQIPDEWLQAVCRDLFSMPGKKPDETNSLEAFAALFDATAKAKIGTSGIDFEIDRKGAKRIAAEA
jgi:hypothetical protein